MMDCPKFIMKSCKLEKVDLIQDGTGYFLEVSYIINTECNTSRRVFNLELPICTTGLDVPCIGDGGKPLQADVGFGPLDVRNYTVEILEEKRIDMTLEQIEKRLGYKINLVNEKSGEL